MNALWHANRKYRAEPVIVRDFRQHFGTRRLLAEIALIPAALVLVVTMAGLAL